MIYLNDLEWKKANKMSVSIWVELDEETCVAHVYEKYMNDEPRILLVGSYRKNTKGYTLTWYDFNGVSHNTFLSPQRWTVGSASKKA